MTEWKVQDDRVEIYDYKLELFDETVEIYDYKLEFRMTDFYELQYDKVEIQNGNFVSF